MKKLETIWMAVTICLVLLFTVVLGVSGDKLYNKEFISYTELVVGIKNGDICEITMNEDSNYVYATMVSGEEKIARVPSVESIADLVTENASNCEVLITGKAPTGKKISTVMGNFLSLIANLLLWIFLPLLIISVVINERKKKNGDVSISNLFDPFGTKNFEQEETSDVTFDDVAGIEEEKSQLEEIVEFMKNPEKYTEIGAEVPRGVLLSGPPGTGKTLLARAIANEAKVAFYAATGSEFVEVYVGVGASRVRNLFEKAKNNAPAIIFIDEFDTVAKKRYSRNSHGEEEQTLNQLLAEMDGFSGSEGVIVIAATNHKEVLDEAVTRPGRFDRKVEIPMPDVTAREKILAVHAKSKKISEEVSLEVIAKKTIGFSGADLKNLLNEAAILAANRNVECIEQPDIDEAFVRVIVGLEKKGRKITEEDKYRKAIHECGHAAVTIAVKPDEEIMSISIVPRGDAGGYNLSYEDEKNSYLKEDALAEIEVLYGGRVAEEVILKSISTGASNDLQRASRIAKVIVTEYAMGDSLLTVTGDSNFDSLLIEKRMNPAEKICQDAYNRTKKIIEDNRDVIEALAKLLMEKEVLTEEDIQKFRSENKFIPFRNSKT